MNSSTHRTLGWSLLLSASFFCIAPVLFHFYPIGFWSSTDYEPLGLADALNMAYRLADVRLYASEGMNSHPGVPFYLMSWLALALAGYPVATTGQTQFFRDVVDHVEVYHTASIYVAAFVGSLGVYVFARTALRLISVGATVVALLLWLVSTPATIECFITTGLEPVALLINGLFLVTLVRLASDTEIDPKVIILAGFVGAFAYLNKLAYVYVPLALVSAIFWKAAFCGIGWRRGSALIALSFFTFVGVVVATGYFHRLECVHILAALPSKRHSRFGALWDGQPGRRQRRGSSARDHGDPGRSRLCGPAGPDRRSGTLHCWPGERVQEQATT
jgi:hypothetical protein